MGGWKVGFVEHLWKVSSEYCQVLLRAVMRRSRTELPRNMPRHPPMLESSLYSVYQAFSFCRMASESPCCKMCTWRNLSNKFSKGSLLISCFMCSFTCLCLVELFVFRMARDSRIGANCAVGNLFERVVTSNSKNFSQGDGFPRSINKHVFLYYQNQNNFNFSAPFSAFSKSCWFLQSADLKKRKKFSLRSTNNCHFEFFSPFFW